MDENKTRQCFKMLNHFMVFLWRLGLGNWMNLWPEVTGKIMVITHTGRKSGLRRHTPVNFAEVDGEIYCMAGFGNISDWYRNLKTNAKVEIWLPSGWYEGVAEDITESPDRLKYVRQVMIGSGKIVDRIYGLDPYNWSDEEVEKAAGKYRLIRIHRETARTGSGGPGDLAWIWPLATLLLLPLACKKQKRKCC